MSGKTWIRYAMVAAAVLVAMAVVPGLVHKARATSGLNLVYVTSNVGATPNMNSVFAWSNDGAGNLTPVAGSPYLTGGTGFFDPDALTASHLADNEIAIDFINYRLYTVNADSNTIAALNINSDGSLTPVAGSPFPSLGIEPLSLTISKVALSSNRPALSVANMGQDPNQTSKVGSITVFQINTDGSLRAVPGGDVVLGTNSIPTQVQTGQPSGKKVLAMQIGTMSSTVLSTLYSYEMGPNGNLQALSTATVPAGDFLVGMAVNTAKPVVYAGYPSNTAFNVYALNKDTGALTYIQTVPSAGTALCWLRVNSAGSRLYTIESESNSLTVYDLSHAEYPSQIQHITVNPGGPTEAAFDPTGQFLYVLTGLTLHILNVSPVDGTLTETAPPVTMNLAAGEHPIGVATVLR